MSIRSILEEWPQVSLPPVPTVAAETALLQLDVETTALLLLDLQVTNCTLEGRPRCVDTLPAIARLLRRARQAGAFVAHSLTRNATRGDLHREVASLEDEPTVQSSVDKFYGTDLESLLAAHKVRTVILVGTSAHGAVLHTSVGAAMRGYKVVVPVDGLSADDPFAELSTCWHLLNGPGTRRSTRLTRCDSIAFVAHC